MARKIIIAILGIALIAGAVFLSRKLREQRQSFRPQVQKAVTAVLTDTVENTTSSVQIVASGQIFAKRRIELFAEARGVLQPTGKEFKPGVYYARGEVLLKIDSEQEQAALRAQKSGLFNQIVALMPDLRLDYPESFDNWNAYVQAFDIEAPVQPLPEPVSDREKLFLAGRNIYTAYYNTVTLESSLRDFTVVAPFDGVITDALVQPGTMVSPGQKCGEMLDPGVYELEAAVNVEYLDLLKLGEPVTCRNIARTNDYKGVVSRINGRVDRATQTITVFIEVRGSSLKEGMYLEALIEGRDEKNTYEIPRKILVNDRQVFYVRDSVLALKDVDPIFYKENSVVVRGLDNGMQILAQPVPGSYPGMIVKVLDRPQNGTND